MKRQRRFPWLGLLFALALTVPSSVSCGGAQGRAALVKEEPMAPSATFKGVWFNPVWGELHLVTTEGNSVYGKWRSDSSGVWGQLNGTISNDVLRFTWEERKTGGIGPGFQRKGKGYFKYVPVEAPDMPRLKGEWGLSENETGGGEWNCVLQKDVPPRPDKIGGDSDPTIDKWDKPIKK